MRHAALPLALLLHLPAFLGAQEARPPYRDPARPVGQRAADLLARMTLEEKFWQLFLHPGDSATLAGAGRYGVQVRTTGSSRDAARQLNAVQRRFVEGTRLGIPVILVDEALHGVAEPGAVVFPQAIALAATWDTALVGRVAAATAREARARGIRQVLSPVLNLASDARWGRVEETYGEDPWLAGVLAEAFVRPLEAAGIVTTPKHLVANVGEGGRDSYPIEWSVRRLRELELPPFERALVHSGARSVMAAYNSVDGAPASAAPWLLRDLLRGAWGFPGVVISDAGGVGGANVLHGTAVDYADATARALLAGLDVIFQGGVESAPLFQAAFERGLVPAAVVDSAVARVLRLKFALGLFEAPYADSTAAALATDDPAARLLAREAATASAVLLQNHDLLLPLDARALRSVAVIGPDAAEARLGGYAGPGRRVVSILDGLRARLGPGRVRFEPGPGRLPVPFATIPARSLQQPRGGGRGLRAEYFTNPALEGTPAAQRVDSTVDFHWTFLPPVEPLDKRWYSVRWTGTLVAPVSGPMQLGVEGNDGFRLYLDEQPVIDAWEKRGFSTRRTTLAAVRGRAYRLRLEFREPAGNGRVRLFWDIGRADRSGAAIERAVVAARAADVVVVVAGLEEGEFRDRASLDLPGRQEELIRRVAATGRPVVVVLIGGGPVTMAGWLDRVAAVLAFWYPGEAGGEALADLLLGDAAPGGRLPFTVPQSVGQVPLVYHHKPTGRGDDYTDLSGEPLFPFGYGLGYTTFSYGELRFSRDTIGLQDTIEVRCTVRNTGSRAGDEVVQLYLRDPVASIARPVLQLRGARKIHLAPGEAREVSFVLGPDDFTLLDAALHPVVEPGDFDILVGASSKDLRLRGTLIVR